MDTKYWFIQHVFLHYNNGLSTKCKQVVNVLCKSLFNHTGIVSFTNDNINNLIKEINNIETHY